MNSSTSVRPVTRRRFLAFSGVAAAGALGLGATRVNWSQLLDAAATNPLDPTAGVLVVVTLYGGNDGLNTVVPASDPAYRDARPELAYGPDEVLDLGEGLGLNPGMKGLKALWDNGSLAIVRGVGYPQPDRSHFRSMAIWQTASPATSSSTGWLGRWLDATTSDPLTAVSLESVLPPLLAGEKVAAASFPLSGLRLPQGELGAALRQLGHPDPADGPWQARVATSLADLQRAAAVLGPATDRAAPERDRGTPEDDTEQKGASAGGAGQLGAQLDMVADLIELGVPTRAYSVSLGGFDTHSDERGTQERLLGQLDAALSGFQRRLQTTDRGKQVTVLVYSEFGRRVTANGSDGTDHGTAGPVFVLGRGVRGGFHGAEPSLTDLDGGDLKQTTDFRAVYASLLDGVLGADPAQVLDGWSSPLPGLLLS
ncbi:MAG TPA: DUF1501 domain-containing protein [Pseudonocardia sp.]|nr:DUF1501 domain-containing protein [Pseudonocardia sp.]